KQNEVFEQTVSEMERTNTPALPNEIKQLVKTYSIKNIFREQAEQINLPQFYLQVPSNDLFGIKETFLPLEKENLLDGFALSKANTNIECDSIASERYKVDLDETKKEHTPTFIRLDGDVKESIVAYMLDPSRKDSRIRNFTKRIMNLIGNMYPIADKEIEKYI